MKPPSRPIAAPCLPNEATNHPCTTLNRLPQTAISSDGWDRSLGPVAVWPFWRASPPPDLLPFLCTAGLELLTVTRDLLQEETLVLHVITHLVADVGTRALPRGSFVGTFGHGHVVDVLLIAVGCYCRPDGRTLHFGSV